MSPRSRPPRRTTSVVAALLVVGGLIGSACGSSSGSATGPVTTLVRSEPVSGRQASSASPRPAAASDSPVATSTLPPSSSSASGPAADDASVAGPEAPTVVTGAQALLDGGLTPLLGRRVGLIANRASTVGGERLIDVLHDHPDIELVALFAPEHGVEAANAAGVTVLDGIDGETGVPIQSLYDDDRAPDPEVLDGLDVVVFDLQDAGARFYTYISTLGLAMQASAGAGVPFLVLDRPNPLGGDRPDGATLNEEQASFVGLYPIPALHGLTVGELAGAIQGEGWLDGLDDLELEVVELQGWSRGLRWNDTGLAWTAPSPGLPTAELALLYPATVLLEATTVSFGRGTDRPFGQFGAPWLDAPSMVARLRSAELAGVAFETTEFVDGDGEVVPGVRLLVTDEAAVRPMAVGVHLLHHLLAEAGDRTIIDRPDYFDLLAGDASLRRDLAAGRDPGAVVDGWSDDVAAWQTTRAPYLRYPDPTD